MDDMIEIDNPIGDQIADIGSMRIREAVATEIAEAHEIAFCDGDPGRMSRELQKYPLDDGRNLCRF